MQYLPQLPKLQKMQNLCNRALQGNFATIPGLTWLTDSVAFWLRIKTPTMRFGKRKKDNK